MVDKNFIMKSLDDAIEKCGVSMKKVASAIESTVKNMTDSTEEYDLLMDIIPKFYKDHYNLDHEELYIQDYNGKEYTNVSADEGSVEVPEDASDEGFRNGLLVAMHNHPIGASCFQSDMDFAVATHLSEKYMVTVANDGIMISKCLASNKNPNYVGNVRSGLDQKILAKFYTEEKWGVMDLQEKLRNSTITQEEANKEATKIINKYYTDYMDSEVKDLNKRFKDADMNITVTHISI